MVARKRFFTRHPIILKVRVRSPSGWIETVSDDVSRRGLFLRTLEPIPVGRIAQLEILLPNGHKLEAMGHVRRSVSEASETDPIPGMGIEFFVMSREAQDAWDRFVIEKKRAGASRLEETDEMPRGHRAVPTPLPGITDHDETSESGLPSFLRESGEEPASAAIQAANGAEAWDAHVQDDDDDGQSEPVAPEAVEPAITTPTPAPASPTLMRDTLADSHGRKIPEELARVIEAARDAAAEIESLEQEADGPVVAPTAASGGPSDAPTRDTLITVQPSTSGRLSHFIDRKMRGSNVFLRTMVQCDVGQRVSLAIVHPETDIELMIDGHVRKLISGDAVRGVLLGFESPNPDERARLQHFVVTGQPTVSDKAAPSLQLKELEDAAGRNPDSADAYRDLGFGLLTISELPDRAVAAFLEALTLDGTNLQTHYGLAVAYALAGDGIKSYAFLRSARSIASESAS